MRRPVRLAKTMQMKRLSSFLSVLLLLYVQEAAHPVFASDLPPLSPRVALALSVVGKLEVSADGKKFKAAHQGDTFSEGAILRVKGSGHTDIFFRRIGTMVRLMPRTQLKIDTLEQHYNPEGKVVKTTVLELKKGRLFAFVRVLFPQSKFQVKTENGLATLQGSGTGRYDIQSNGRFVAGKSSRSSLKVIVEGEERSIEPGNVFNSAEGKTIPLAPSEAELIVLQIDELQRLSELLTPEPAPNEL